ncbi:hypothetical protein BLI708_00385 [Bifidobacterium imperatoris]|nr:hypothetical protein [Bifidobacterium imperatoris]PLS23783.1 terminase [Bifidobacterium imperatoris]QSY57835.1 hypothetical protein BLI708_00385 [Bifidobacterium imperatoris]
MSLKRFNGWTPADDDAVEWDETERMWMLALQSYENRICPLCGMDTRVCHDQDAFEALRLKGEVELCFAAYERNRALEEYRGSGSPDPNASGALTTSLTRKPVRI